MGEQRISKLSFVIPENNALRTGNRLDQFITVLSSYLYASSDDSELYYYSSFVLVYSSFVIVFSRSEHLCCDDFCETYPKFSGKNVLHCQI